MSSPYVGEIRMFAGNFAPVGWMFCEGQLLSKDLYQTLFSLLGTVYGGDGEPTFGLPDLRGRLPLHMGTNINTGTTFTIGEAGGVEEVTLTVNQIPSHNHKLYGSTGNGSQASPKGNVLASSTLIRPYSGLSADTAMAATSIGSTGGNLPHTNLQPYTCINYIISLFGNVPAA